ARWASATPSSVSSTSSQPVNMLRRFHSPFPRRAGARTVFFSWGFLPFRSGMPSPPLLGAFSGPRVAIDGGRDTTPQPRFLAFQPLPSRVAGTLGVAPLFCQVRTRNTFVPQESEPKDILHRIEPRALAARPKRGPDRSLGKNAAVGGDMGQLDAFAGPGED